MLQLLQVMRDEILAQQVHTPDVINHSSSLIDD